MRGSQGSQAVETAPEGSATTSACADAEVPACADAEVPACADSGENRTKRTWL